jgi:hypothetical protein
MIVRTSMVLVVAGTLFMLVGAFAPAANLGAAATPASLYQIVGGLLHWKVGAPELPAGLKAIEMRLIGAAGLLAVSAFFAIALSVFKYLRSSLVPSLLMTTMSGYLMFQMAGIRDVAVVVPNSYGWILLIAGSLVATVTGIFTLFGPGQDERRNPATEAPKKKRGRLPFEVETTSVREPVPPPKPAPKTEAPKAEAPKAEAPKAEAPKADAPPPAKAETPPGTPNVLRPQRDAPKPQRLSKALRGDAAKAEPAKEAKPAAAPEPEPPKEAKPAAPKPEPPTAAEPAVPKPAPPKEAKANTPEPEAPDGGPSDPVEGKTPDAGVPDLEPDTLSPMPASGYSGEEPTESGGWVLSGFDANGGAAQHLRRRSAHRRWRHRHRPQRQAVPPGAERRQRLAASRAALGQQPADHRGSRLRQRHHGEPPGAVARREGADRARRGDRDRRGAPDAGSLVGVPPQNS